MNLGSLIGYLGLDTSEWDQGLDKAEGGLKSFAKKGALIAAAAGAGIAAAVTGAVVAGMDIEAANDKLAAQLGGSAEYSAEMGEIAGKLYANAYGESLGEVNDALRSVLQAGLLPEDATNAQIETITARVMDLSATFEQDLGGATNAVSQMLRTGLAPNAEAALDIITRGFQQGADKNGDYLDTLNEYSTQFRKMGLDGAEATGLISQGLKAGARDGDLVADAIKEFSIRAIDGSEATAQGFESIGLSAEAMSGRIGRGGQDANDALSIVLDQLRNMEDPVARSAAAVALFGTQAEDLGDALYSLDPEAAVGALGNIEGAAARMGQTLNDNASTNIESFKRQAIGAFVNVIGGQVLPIVTSIASTLATQFGPAIKAVGGFLSGTLVPALQSAAQWIAANQTPLMIVAGIITAVFLPALIAMGVQSTIAAAKVVAAWLLQKATAIASLAAQSIAVVAMVAGWVLMGTQALIQAARMAAAWLIALGPIGWAIAAIIGIAAIVIANWDKIVAWTKKAWAWVVDAVKAAIGFIVNLFLNFTGVGLIIKHWNSIKTATSAAWNAVKTAVSGAWTSIKTAVSTGVSNVMGFITSLPGKIVSALSGLGTSLFDIGKNMIQGLLNGAKSLLKNIGRFFLDMVPGWIRGPFESALGIASPSKVFAGYGVNIGEGLIKGMAGMQGAVGSQMMKLADTRALAGLMPRGVDRVQLGDVSQALWDQLLGSGWKGRPGDKMEALYRPADRPAPAATRDAPLFHADTVNVIEGTPRDVAQELAYLGRTRGV